MWYLQSFYSPARKLHSRLGLRVTQNGIDFVFEIILHSWNVFSLLIETLNVRFLPVLIALSDISCNTVHWSSFTIQFTKKRYVKRFLLVFLLYIFEIRMLLTRSQYKCLYAIYTRLQLTTSTKHTFTRQRHKQRLRILPTCMWAIIFLYQTGE